MKSFTAIALALILALGTVIGLRADLSASTAITETIGASLDATGAPSAVLSSVSVLCNGSANCPEALNVDLSNSNTLYGINSTCVKSTNAGVTWGQCTAQPPLTGGATLQGIAATTSGAVISAAATGTNCVIGRSIDGTASWSTVYNAAPPCSGDPGQSNLRCAASGCIIGTNIAGGKIGVFGATDDGQTWASVFNSATITGLPETLYWDGTNGIILTNLRDSDHIIFTSSGISGWASTTNALGITFCYGVTASPNFGLVTICTTAATRRYVNVTNGTITNLTVPNLSNDGFPNTLALGGNHYVASASASCGLWGTSGGQSTFVQDTCNNAFNTAGGELIGTGPKIYNTTRFGGVNAILRVIQ